MAKGPWMYILRLIEANWLKDAKSNCVIVHRACFDQLFSEDTLSTFQNKQQLD